MRAGPRIVGLGVVLLGFLASAHPPVEEVFSGLMRTGRFGQVALSPDGKRVAWVEPVANKSQIQWREVAAEDFARRGVPSRVTARAEPSTMGDEDSVAWSPDSKQLAFLSDAEKEGQPQLYVVEVEGGTPRKLTSLKGQMRAPRWSPDGKTVALLVIEGFVDAQGPMGPAARETGVVRERLPVQRVGLVTVADGTYRALSPADLFIYEHAWSPDGRQLAVTAAPPPGDANWWVAKLERVDVATGRATVLHAPKWQVTEPTWSPDGKQVAFIEGLMSDFGSNGGDVLVVPTEGGKARNLTPGLKASASSLDWPSSKRLLFGAQVGGEAAVAVVDPTRGKVEVLWKGAERVSAGRGVGVSLARDGETSAVLRESFTQAADLWVGKVGAWKRLTFRNADVKAPVGAARSVTWKSDGLDVQGWLLAPASPPPQGTRAPMVTMVHGGPASGVLPGFNLQALLLTSQGFYVFLPNPRGSFGQGEEFVQANRRDFGHGDLRDILAGVDAVVASEPVDGARLGIMGWSYGGFMTMWTVTQTQRFRAAVAGAGIVNWQSYYGTNHIDTWMLPYFGASVYDEPEVYARSSPINFIKQARTPTLVLHGERDVEVPASQGWEFYKALKAQGVKTQLVVYEDEGHGLRKPAHVKDRMVRTVDWLTTNLAPAPPPPPPLTVPAR